MHPFRLGCHMHLSLQLHAECTRLGPSCSHMHLYLQLPACTRFRILITQGGTAHEDPRPLEGDEGLNTLRARRWVDQTAYHQGAWDHVAASAIVASSLLSAQGV